MDKSSPDFSNYLGWCTWDSFYTRYLLQSWGSLLLSRACLESPLVLPRGRLKLSNLLKSSFLSEAWRLLDGRRSRLGAMTLNSRLCPF